jgi:tetratricopeptide (TPR) repeat protein
MGIGGIGKSRLAWEFLKYIDGLVYDVYWHQGRSPAYGEGVAFWALGEIVRMRCGIAEGEDAPSSLEKLGIALNAYVVDPEERRWIEPRLAHLLGLEERPAGEREELFAAWRVFFERIAEQGPTVLVFEDLQWADPGQIDFIEHMLEWSRTYPIFIITLARPELMDRRPNWGAGQRTFSSLHLEPLSNDAMRELLGGLAPGLPDGLVERILDRAEGVPLYAVETVRTLVDQGRLVPEEGTYRPAGDVIELEVPDTLHALIAARLDALPPGDRALLQDAAVLGKTFTTSALSALSGDSEEDLEPRLRDLVRKEVLIFDADPRSPERGQYGFVQSMIREVAYQTLARRDRRARHLAAATFFLQTGDEELAGVVATHFLEAYQAAPEAKESVEVAVQAREALVTAAERASSLGSQDQALRYVGQALELPIEPNERARLWELGADAAVASGQFDAGQAYLERARSWYVDQGDAMAAARITAKLGEAMLEKGDVDPAVRLLQGAMDELGSGADDASTVHLMSQLARAYLLIGDYPNAQVWADRAVAAAEHHDSAGIVADTLITRGISSYLSGRWREGTALLTGALALAEEEGLLLAEVRARLNLADSLGVINPARALTVAKPGLEMARRLGLRLYEVIAAVNGVLPAISTGEWDWADQALEQSAGDDHLDSRVLVMGRMILAAVRGDFERAEDSAIKMEQGVEGSTDAEDHANLYLSKAWLDFTAGRLAEAHRQGLEAARTFTGPTEARATILAGRTALWMGDLDGVREAVQALRQASIRGDWVVNSRRTLEAGLAAKEGRESDAVARYEEAVREWRDLGTPFDLALCHLDRLTVLGPAAPGSDGATREAREIFARLGAVPFIERLNSLIPESQPA